MVKKFLAAAVVLLVMVSGAFGATELWTTHSSITSLKEGKPDFSNARFSDVFFSITTNTPVTKENAQLTGNITLSGGNYSFWDGRELQKVSGTPATYILALENNTSSGDNASYEPFTELMPDSRRGDFRAGVEADNGLNGVNVSWNFPDAPSLNGSATLPEFMTTQEQLGNGVLYFEFKLSGDLATGIDWRIVKSSDLSLAVSQDFEMRLVAFEVWDYDEDEILNARPGISIEAGRTPEGTYTFDSPIKQSDICLIRTRLYTYPDAGEEIYTWYYAEQSAPGMSFWSSHNSHASLVNGKSDYSNAAFSEIFFCITESNPVIAEAKHFTDAGQVTIPGGGYMLKDFETGGDIRTITGDATMKLRFDPEGSLGDKYLEYWPADDNGRLSVFTRGAETGLNGKTIAWTFPAELGIAGGNGKIPDYKPTSAQLTSGVPYVEIVSEDGYITAVNYRIVTANDATAAITPAYRTDLRFCFDSIDGIETWINTKRSEWQRNTASGIYTLDIPQPLSNVKRIRALLRSYEESDNPAVYQWNFYPASAPAPLEITTATLPNATVNNPYTAALTANIPGATWSVSSGTLPAGLTLNSSTGTISGTPTTANTYTFTVRATSGTQSAEKSFTVSVTQTPPATITITTESLPSGTLGTSYSATLTASTTGATWSVISGTLPSGLTLNPATGAITGTPAAANTYTFTVRAVLGSARAEKQFTIVIPSITITTGSLPEGRVGQQYNAALAADVSSVEWSVRSGTLPAGLTLNSRTGEISGTPTTANTYTFTLRAVRFFEMAEKQFTITISAAQGTGGGSSGGGCSSFTAVFASALAFIISKKR